MSGGPYGNAGRKTGLSQTPYVKKTYDLSMVAFSPSGNISPELDRTADAEKRTEKH